MTWQNWHMEKYFSDLIRSVAQLCPTLCDPMNRSKPGLPVHHQLPEFTETHVHRVSDAIQPSHPLLSPSPLAPNPSQHQESFPMSQPFAWGGQSTGVSALASFLPKKSQGWSPSILIQVTFKTTLWGIYYCNSDFTYEETATQFSFDCPNSLRFKWWSGLKSS